MSFGIYLGTFVCISIFTIISSFLITSFVVKKEYGEMVNLDITVSQMEMLEKRLSDFLRENHLEKSAGISEIAGVLNVSNGGEDSSLSSQAHLSDLDKFGVRKVTFKKGLTLEKKNFAYARECAHLINEDIIYSYTRPDGHNKTFVKQLADYAAAAILMPEDEIYEYLKSNSYEELPSKKRVTIIRSLCKKYKVSEVIVLCRVKEVCNLKQL